MTWLPSPALARALVVAVVAAVLGLLVGRPDLVVLAAPFWLFAVAGLVGRPATVPTVDVRLRDRVVVEGQGTVVETEIRGAGIETLTCTAAATPYVATRPVAGVTSRVVPPGRLAHIALAAAPMRWGRRTVAGGTLTAWSGWAGYRWGPARLPTLTVTALPRGDLFDGRAEVPHPLGLIGVNRARRPGDGADFLGIRPFVLGDRLRRVHWRSSLRPGPTPLHVVTTTSQEDSAVLLLVDATTDVGASGGIGGSASSLDVAVRAAAALGAHHLRLGDRVGLRVIAPRPVVVPPGTGARHHQRVLQSLARIHPGSVGEYDARRLRLGLGTAGVVLVLTPLLAASVVDTVAVLGRSGHAVVVVDTLPPGLGVIGDTTDRLAWRMRLLERDLHLTAIARSGIPVVAWRGPGTLDEVLRRLARRAQLPRTVRR